MADATVVRYVHKYSLQYLVPGGQREGNHHITPLVFGVQPMVPTFPTDYYVGKNWTTALISSASLCFISLPRTSQVKTICTPRFRG